MARVTKAATRELELAPGTSGLGAGQVGVAARTLVYFSRVPKCMMPTM